jgi:hypothetical protein
MGSGKRNWRGCPDTDVPGMSLAETAGDHLNSLLVIFNGSKISLRMSRSIASPVIRSATFWRSIKPSPE